MHRTVSTLYSLEKSALQSSHSAVSLLINMGFPVLAIGKIRKEDEAIRQEVSELTATNYLLKEQTASHPAGFQKLYIHYSETSCRY